jgi:hypothetical protein
MIYYKKLNIITGRRERKKRRGKAQTSLENHRRGKNGLHYIESDGYSDNLCRLEVDQKISE